MPDIVEAEKEGGEVVMPNNVIYANFSPEFRSELVGMIKHKGGPQFNQQVLMNIGWHPSFAKAIVRSIMRREGW